jgi:hypothetical protein
MLNIDSKLLHICRIKALASIACESNTGPNAVPKKGTAARATINAKLYRCLGRKGAI